MEFNKLQLMRSTEYVLFENIKVRQPTLAELAEFTEGNDGFDKFMLMVNAISLRPIDIADILWVENKILYTDFASPWEFFISRAFTEGQDIVVTEEFEGQTLSSNAHCANIVVEEALNYFFNKTGHYIFITDNKNKQEEDKPIVYLMNIGEDGIITDNAFKFTEVLYHLLVEFLNIITWNDGVPLFMRELKSKNAGVDVKIGNKRLLKALLENAYKKRNSKHKSSVTFDSIVSALIAEQHNSEQIWNFPLYLVYDQYHRVNKIKVYSETMAALNSGCYDTKKHPINWEKIDWASVITL